MMKHTIAHNMKHSLSAVALLTVALSIGTLVAASAQTKPINKKQSTKISTYFDNRLNDQQSQYQTTETFAPSSTDRYRRAVWELWVKAVEELDEEKLPEYAPLSEGATGKWTLPPQLEADAVMPFYFGTKGDEPEYGYPLFLYLHGSGDKESEWATGLKICSRFDDSPSLYFIPQIPNENSYRWHQPSKQYAWEKLLRLAMVSDRIDGNRIYMFGISEGGYSSQRMGSFYADYLAAVGPMAGGEPLINAPVENCSNTPFSLLTGSNDFMFERYMLTSFTEERFDELQKQYPDYYTHRIELIEGRGHGIDYSPTTPWLKEFVRYPYPKFVNWENFEMEGRYRDCFDNIEVTARSVDSEGSRARYLMTIIGNTIDIKVDMVTYTTVQMSKRWNFPIKYEKSYTPATNGRFKIYLSSELVDLESPVTVIVNGVKYFEGNVKCQLDNLVNSCVTFFDRYRLYPAAVDVDLSTIK